MSAQAVGYQPTVTEYPGVAFDVVAEIVKEAPKTEMAIWNVARTSFAFLKHIDPNTLFFATMHSFVELGQSYVSGLFVILDLQGLKDGKWWEGATVTAKIICFVKNVSLTGVHTFCPMSFLQSKGIIVLGAVGKPILATVGKVVFPIFFAAMSVDDIYKMVRGEQDASILCIARSVGYLASVILVPVAGVVASGAILAVAPTAAIVAGAVAGVLDFGYVVKDAYSAVAKQRQEAIEAAGHPHGD